MFAFEQKRTTVVTPFDVKEHSHALLGQVIVHCGDYKCGHSVTMYPALWPDNVRLSDLEERFVCTVCGHRGADVRPLFEQAPTGTG